MKQHLGSCTNFRWPFISGGHIITFLLKWVSLYVVCLCIHPFHVLTSHSFFSITYVQFSLIIVHILCLTPKPANKFSVHLHSHVFLILIFIFIFLASFLPKGQNVCELYVTDSFKHCHRYG